MKYIPKVVQDPLIVAIIDSGVRKSAMINEYCVIPSGQLVCVVHKQTCTQVTDLQLNFLEAIIGMALPKIKCITMIAIFISVVKTLF